MKPGAVHTGVPVGVDCGREAEQLAGVVVDDVELAASDLDVDFLNLPPRFRLAW